MQGHGLGEKASGHEPRLPVPSGLIKSSPRILGRCCSSPLPTMFDGIKVTVSNRFDIRN